MHNTGGAPWKCRAVENEENQNQVSLRFSPPFGNRCCDSHIPTAPAIAVFLTRKPIRETKKGARQSERLNFTLQAHPWIRKC